MSDRALSGLILIVAAIYGAYLFWRHLQSAGAAAASPAGPGTAPGGSPPVLPKPTAASVSPLAQLLSFARMERLPVTSGEHFNAQGQAVLSPADLAHTGHAPNSLHYQGRAIDVGVRGANVGQVIADATAAGFRVLKELYTGSGPYGYSSGPHLHIEAPASRFAEVAP